MSTQVHHAEPGIFQKYFWSTDHKMIAMQYMFTGMAMALIGGFLAYVFRMQLGFPNKSVPGFGIVTPGRYNAVVTMHGTIMIFWVAMPILIAAFGNFLIPLMIGADDMAFPRINRLSYQIFLVSILVLLASFFVKGGAFGGAWTAYPPLSASGAYNLTPAGATLWLVAVALEFMAFLLGGINFTVTTMGNDAGAYIFTPVKIGEYTVTAENVRHPDDRVDDRPGQRHLHGFCRTADRGRGYAALRPDAFHWFLRSNAGR